MYRKGVISNCRAIGLVFDASPYPRLEPYQATKPGREETWKGNWVMFIQLRIYIYVYVHKNPLFWGCRRIWEYVKPIETITNQPNRSSLVYVLQSEGVTHRFPREMHTQNHSKWMNIIKIVCRRHLGPHFYAPIPLSPALASASLASQNKYPSTSRPRCASLGEHSSPFVRKMTLALLEFHWLLNQASIEAAIAMLAPPCQNDRDCLGPKACSKLPSHT